MCNVKECQSLCSSEITELAKSMLKVQQGIRPANKDNYNEFTRSKYATLASVMEACRDALIENGIWVTQYPVNISTTQSSSSLFSLGLVTKLTHVESGQWQSSLLVMPLPKNDPQGYGSALTYARRYGLSALVGIVTEDDDGNIASNHRPSTTVLNSENQGGFRAHKAVYSGTKSVKNPKVDKPQNNQQTPINNLPKIDGVVFKQAKSTDGVVFITATGKTQSKKTILKQAGFRWDPKQKLWWKTAS